MTTYIVKSTGCQLWRSGTGNRGEIMPAGSVFDSNSSMTIKDIFCRKVESGPYADGKNYAQANDLDVYADPNPTPVGDIVLEYPPGALQLKLVQPDGTYKIAQNTVTVILEIVEG